MALQAALLAVKVDEMLREELELEINSQTYRLIRRSCWAICAIPQNVFSFSLVLSQLSYPEQWHHKPGPLNPADVLSRGQTMDRLDKELWFGSPTFISQHRSQWIIRGFHIRYNSY